MKFLNNIDHPNLLDFKAGFIEGLILWSVFDLLEHGYY